MAEVTCTGRSADPQRAADRSAGSRCGSRFDAALARLRQAGAEADGQAPGPTSPWCAASAVRAPTAEAPTAQGVQDLRAAVRALPAAVAAHPRGGLALSFGSGLTVDLRAGVQGLELTLRPAPALERAARAELPGLVDALRARGLRVARSDIQSRATGAPGPRAR